MHFPLPIRESEETNECEICGRTRICISLPSIQMSHSNIEKMRKEISQLSVNKTYKIDIEK